MHSLETAGIGGESEQTPTVNDTAIERKRTEAALQQVPGTETRTASGSTSLRSSRRVGFKPGRTRLIPRREFRCLPKIIPCGAKCSEPVSME